MTSDEDQIRQLVDTWMEKTRQGDIDAVADLMTEDVVFLVVGKPPFGKREFLDNARAQAQLAGMKFDGHSQVHEIAVLGDWAYLWTHLDVTMTQPGKPPMSRSGNTLTVLRKGDGQWRLARDANLLVAT